MLARRTVVDVLADLLIALVAVAGIWRAVSGPDRVSGPLLLALALVAVAGRVLQERQREGALLLGSQVSIRGLLAAGTAALLAARAGLVDGDTAPAAATVPAAALLLATALLVGGATVERFLSRAARFHAPVVAHLPGVTSLPRGRDLSEMTVAASLVATGAGLVVAWAGWSPWWWLLCCVLALLPPAWLVLRSRGEVVRARHLRAEVPRAVADYAPQFVVYTSRPDDASHQVTMWLPYLKRTGLRFLVVTRNSVPAVALARLTDVPVVEARRIADLEALVPPSLKAAFYVNASSGNGALVRYQHLTHVYLGHGDSDKPPSYNPTHAMYDQIFAAGAAATRRYAAHGVRIPEDKFRIVGRPQVESVTPAERPIAEVAEPVVLYAPTWRGHVEETKLSSLLQGEQIVEALLARGATVIFRPHPFSHSFGEDAAAIRRIQQRLEADAGRSRRRHLWGAEAETVRDVLDCINASDAMVSDVSSVVSDYLFSGKPFAMVAVPREPAEFVEEYPVAAAAYVVRGDLGNLDGCLEQLLGPDPAASRRAAIRVDYLGDFPVTDYASGFVRAVAEVASTTGGHEEDDTDEAGDDPSGSSSAWSSLRRPLQSLGLVGVATVLSVATLAAAVLDTPNWLIGLLALVSVLVGLGSGWDSLRSKTRRQQLLAEFLAGRAALLVALAVVVADRAGPGRAGPDAGWVLALALLAVSLAGESHIRSAWGRVGLEAEGLSSLSSSVAQIVPRWLVMVLSCLAIPVELGLALAGAPDWVAATLSAVVFAVFADALVRALLRAVRSLRAEDGLYGALERYAPAFAVYFASTVGASYQVGMWLPYFARIGRPFVVVTRSVPMMREIAAVAAAQHVSVPVVYRPTLRSLEDVVVPSMSAAFYVNNAVRNTHFVERRELIHVWLNHGDSEKPACYNPVHAIYDLLFAAGQAGIDRYARHGVEIPAEKFRVVGRPQVESIRPARGPIRDQTSPTVLYAPTWQGPFADSRVYSLPFGRQIVTELLARGARVIFRAHPFNYRYDVCVAMISEIGRLLDADRAATGRQHLWGPAAEQDLSVEDCFNASDAMISDISAVVSDYLHADKPLAIVSVGRTPEMLLKEVPAARAAYVLRQDLSNLDEVCTQLLRDDPLADERRETRRYYLGDFDPEHYAEGFLQAARQVIADGRRREGAEVTRG